MNIAQLLTKLKALIYSKSETDSLLGGKANSSHTHTKSQITDFPTIPSKTSQLTNDSGFLNYSVKNKTGIGSLGYVNDATDNVLITSNTLAYWDGAYSGTSSNLTYCKKGAFGDIVTHNASEFLSVTRGSSISTGGSGYWAAMCNSSETGSSTLPTTNQWWHVLSMDWSGNSNDVTAWCSQLALPTQQNSCLYWRRNNSGGTSINNSTWHKVIDDTNIGSQSVNYANSAGSVAWSNVSGKPSTFTPSSHTHTKSQITDFPTIPSKTSQLTNDSGFLTSHQSLANYSTLANTIKSLSISGRTITYTKGDNSTGTLTTQDNNTWTAMKGATSSANGSVGYVNAVPPKDGYNTKYLRADGTWQVPPDHTYTVNNATLTIQKNGTTVKTFTANASSNVTCNITVPTKTSELTNNSGFLTSHQSLSGYVPRSGGGVMTGASLGRNVNTDRFDIYGGAGWDCGGTIVLCGASYSDAPGIIKFHPYKNASTNRDMWLKPDGTWTWNGTAVQLISDKRLKQQISKIDNALLDAWEDVEPVQFKYNDAVDQKGDTARLHTGYVVQQIDEACKSHNLDISAYGLYCHEEYPEETEEVEVEQEDGTKIKERKVIREASEHYSLRYTETLVVECAFLRREVKRLSERLSKLEQPSTSEK